MEQLQGNFSPLQMDGAGDLAVLFRVCRGFHTASADDGCAVLVRAETAGDHQSDITLRALGEVGGQPFEGLFFFQTGVHRTHEHTVLEGGETQVQGAQEVWIVGHGRRSSCPVSAGAVMGSRGLESQPSAITAEVMRSLTGRYQTRQNSDYENLALEQRGRPCGGLYALKPAPEPVLVHG